MTYCVLCTVMAKKREQKHRTKNFTKLHNHFNTSINYGLANVILFDSVRYIITCLNLLVDPAVI